MRATIKDVAKKAGVSPATVSLVLNKRDAPVSSVTRRLVEAAAAELGYRPNQLAVGLVTKKTNIIGLIVPDNSNYFQADYSTQIEREVSRYGYHLIVGIANENADKVIRYLHDFMDRGVDGIILVQSVFEDEDKTRKCVEAIRCAKVPVALTDRVPAGYDLLADTVVLDDVKGGYLATGYLLELGHTRIGLITGPLYMKNCTDRMEGARQAFAEFEVPFDSTLIYEGDFQAQSGMDALPYLLGQGVTAIFAFNDMMALGVYKQARNYNIRIPEDLSVVGFDDILISDLAEPPLTTVKFPLVQMAKAVVERLIAIIEQKAEPPEAQLQVFSPQLKVKGSTRRR